MTAYETANAGSGIDENVAECPVDRLVLPKALFVEIAAAIGEPVEGSGGGQRRESRVSLSSRLTVIPCPQGVYGPHSDPLAVPVRDLSRGGMRFLFPNRLPLDSHYIVLLPRPAASQGGTVAPLAVLAAVTYWQPMARDLFAIGGQFLGTVVDMPLPRLAPREVLPDIKADGFFDNGQARRLAS